MVSVQDGDTVTLRSGTSRIVVRLSDIDAPEISHAGGGRDVKLAMPTRPGQPGGRAAAASLLQLMPIGAKARAECYEVDQYGRQVCHVFAGGVNVNLEQLRRGWATLPSNKAWVRDPQSAEAQADARSRQAGIWNGGQPQAPAQWRKVCWRDGVCSGAEP